MTALADRPQAPLAPEIGEVAGSSGQRPASMGAMEKLSKFHRASKKASKVLEKETVRRQKAIDWEIDKALKKAKCLKSLPQPVSDRAATLHLFSLQPLELPEQFDSQPEIQWSLVGTGEEASVSLPDNRNLPALNLPGNREPLLTLWPEDNYRGASGQHGRQKAGIEATFMPTATGLCSGKEGRDYSSGLQGILPIPRPLLPGIPASIFGVRGGDWQRAGLV